MRPPPRRARSAWSAWSGPPARSILCTPPPQSAWPPPDPWHGSGLVPRPSASLLGTLLALTPATPLPLPLGCHWAPRPGGQAWTVPRSRESLTAEGTPPGAHGPGCPSRVSSDCWPRSPKPLRGLPRGRAGLCDPGTCFSQSAAGIGASAAARACPGASSCCEPAAGHTLGATLSASPSSGVTHRPTFLA